MRCMGAVNVTPTHAWRDSAVRILEVGFLLVLPPLLHYAVPITPVVRKPLGYLGGAPMVIGLVLMAAARDAFRDAGTTFTLHGGPHRGPSSLVASGPFGVSRNPMYLGMLLWLLGLAVFFGSLVTFVFPLALFALAQFVLIPAEEAELERLFGGTFNEYRQAVRRWI
jgi:protein-S-isoprenylcysteine O-methyltransferase Ste14